MRRLKIVAGWLGLLCAAALMALLFLSVKAAAEDRDRAMDSAEAAIADLRETRETFRAERQQLHDQVDNLVQQVGALRRQSATLRRQVEVLQEQVVSMGGTPQPVERGALSSGPVPEPEPTHPGCVNGRGPKDCR